MGAVKTTTKELGESRVRVDVEVAAEALQRELDGAASEIGRDMKVPGFRKGKVPSQVVLQQVGREAVLDEAVRRGLPSWYEEAVRKAGIAAVGNPQLDLADLPPKGSPLAFSFEVGVRPPAICSSNPASNCPEPNSKAKPRASPPGKVSPSTRPSKSRIAKSPSAAGRSTVSSDASDSRMRSSSAWTSSSEAAGSRRPTSTPL